MMRSRTSSRRVAAVSLVLLLVLLAISVFIYSPWHRHSRLSSQACSFSSFEHAFGLEASSGIPIEPPAVMPAGEADRQMARPSVACEILRPGRAPPA
jgi:hypothetical protein